MNELKNDDLIKYRMVLNMLKFSVNSIPTDSF